LTQDTIETKTTQATSPEPSVGVLRHHRLTHLPVVQIGRSIRDAKMARGCDSNQCKSTCCGTGVLADSAEQARILAHVDEIRRAMDDDMEKDPSKWFDDEKIHDRDFPSGVAIGTQTTSRGCIFLNEQMRCVLQKAHADGLTSVVLKPFYCFAFPITLDKGTLSMDIDNVEGTPACCVPVPDGQLAVVDVFEWELEHVLCKEGLAELRGQLGS
jgi:hypothetical protein